MRVASALDLVNSIVYKPDWKISAEDHTNRYEDAIKIRIDYPARNSNRDEAANNYPTPIMTYATFVVIVGDCGLDSMLRRIVEKLIEIEAHEVREFFRLAPTLWAPFHPHNVDGMKRWGEMDKDLQFGLA
jgi:hypothetical protein